MELKVLFEDDSEQLIEENKGFVQLQRKVLYCFELSSIAKNVYFALISFRFSDNDIFPSQDRLSMLLDRLSRPTIITALKELERKGFISIERRGRNWTNVYIIKSIKNVNHVQVSEMFWSVINDYNKYPIHYLKKVLYKVIDDFLPTLKVEFSQLEVSFEMKDIIQDLFNYIMEGGEIVNYRYKPKMINLPKELNNEEDSNKWSNTDFVNYFQGKCKEHLGEKPKINEAKALGIIKRVLGHLEGNKNKLKDYIDTYFIMGYPTLHIDYFGTNARYEEIKLYLSTGKKPHYILKENEIKEKVTEKFDKYDKLDAKSVIERLME